MSEYNTSPLKWTGSKRNTLHDVLPVLEALKKDILVEPFMGALNIALNMEMTHYYLSDINEDVVNFFNWCVDYPEELILESIELFSLGMAQYKVIREMFNLSDKNTLSNAARFLYLNKYGFNGLIRYNRKGFFNVAMGSHPEKIRNVPIDEIRKTSSHLKGRVTFRHCEFNELMQILPDSCMDQMLVYCDPPYIPITLSSFNYSKDGVIAGLHDDIVYYAERLNAPVAISNHLTPYTRKLYKEATAISTFNVRRSVSCKSETRGDAPEVLAVYI